MTGTKFSEVPANTLFQTRCHLILASGSPRRRQFFDELGIDFDVQWADVEERVRDNEEAEHFVRRLSQDKALAVAHKNPDAWVVGADTVVVLGTLILGKPGDSREAFEMLAMLNGRWHEVWTAYTICNERQSVRVQQAIKTEVHFFDNSKDLLQAYVALGESLDKAGAYGIQGRGGLLVEQIRGSYSNVVGLPLAEVINSLIDLGVLRAVEPILALD